MDVTTTLLSRPAAVQAPAKAIATSAAREGSHDGKDLPVSGNSAPTPPPPPPSGVEKAVAQIKAWLSDSSRELAFQIDEDSGRTVITVTNPATGEIIRQIPSEEALRFAASLAARGGLGVDELA